MNIMIDDDHISIINQTNDILKDRICELEAERDALKVKMEKAIAEARADGYKQGYNQMNASSDYIDDYEYARRVMEDER